MRATQLITMRPLVLLSLFTSTLLSAARSKVCTKNSDCSERELCLRGVCTCPVLFTGPGCKKPRTPVAKGCLQVFAAWPSKGYNPSGIDFSHCAVVGNSGILKGSKHGNAIDAATAVFRFNEAPTIGYEQDVGRWKPSTIRFQNKERGGFAEKSGERCVIWSTNEYDKSHSNRRCKVTTMGSSLEAYAKDYFARHGKVKRGMPSQTAKMSNGFLGIVFALHLCAKVDIYGFDQGQGYYFRKFTGVPKGWGANKFIKPSTRPFRERHSWDAERACINALAGRLHSVTMYVKHSKLYNRSASPPGGRQELEALQDVAPADSAIGEADPAVQGDEEEAQEEGQKLEGEQDPSAPLPPDVIAAMLRKVQQGMNTTLEIARLRGAAIRSAAEANYSKAANALPQEMGWDVQRLQEAISEGIHKAARALGTSSPERDISQRDTPSWHISRWRREQQPWARRQSLVASSSGSNSTTMAVAGKGNQLEQGGGAAGA